jgi:hypothetical protein
MKEGGAEGWREGKEGRAGIVSRIERESKRENIEVCCCLVKAHMLGIWISSRPMMTAQLRLI